MEEINFEGKIVKPTKTGIYRCPYNCGRADYAQPKWKTERGFRKHMTECVKRPSAVEKRNAAAQDKLDEIEDWKRTLDFIKDQVFHEIPFKIGDVIFYSKKIIVKDTHEQRGSRLVKVRYEPVLRFEAVKVIIETIDFDTPRREPDVEYAKELVLINGFLSLRSALFSNYEEAKEASDKRTKADEEYRHHSSMLR